MTVQSWSGTPANNVLANTGFTMDEGMAPSAVNDSVRQLMADVKTRFDGDFATTATAAGTTTLTAASVSKQEFTGTTTQTIVLPVATTLTAGHPYDIINNSTGALTINSSGGNLVQTVNAGARATITCILASGTTAASWAVGFSLATTAAGAVSGLITANAGLTVASGQTLTLTGATVAGAPTWSSSQAITLSTAAQPNVTSTGALTGGSIASGFGSINIGSNSLTAGAISGSSGIAIGGASVGAGGIAFPATAVAVADANTLDDYEEGTWTPVDSSGAGLSLTVVSATYTKIGRQVNVRMQCDYPVTANGSQAIIGGLPFTVANTTVGVGLSAAVAAIIPNAVGGQTYMSIRGVGDVATTNTALSNTTVFITLTYFI